MLRDLFLVPNLITLSRIFLSPLIILVFDSALWVLAILLYTVVSDFADGFVARRMGLRTPLGAVLDPVADKILVLCFLAAAYLHQIIAPWMIVALVARDLYVALNYPLFLIFHPKASDAKVESKMGGKITTAIQFLCLALLAFLPMESWKDLSLWSPQAIPFLLLYPLSLWTMIDYTLHYWRMLLKAREAGKTNESSKKHTQ